MITVQIQKALDEIFSRPVSTVVHNGVIMCGRLNDIDPDFKPPVGEIVGSFQDKFYPSELRVHVGVIHNSVCVHYRICKASEDSDYEAFIAIMGVTTDREHFLNSFSNLKDRMFSRNE